MINKKFIIDELRHLYLNFYECCLLTKGIKRSIVVDYQRNFFYFIPNDLAEIIIKCNRETVQNILSKFDDENQKTAIQYFKYLYKNELIFFTEDILPFTKVNTEIEFPFSLNNAVIDLRGKLNFNLSDALLEFQNLNVQDVQFRIYDNGLHFVNLIIDELRKNTFEYIEILLNFESLEKLSQLYCVINDNPSISLIKLYKTPKNVYRRKNYKTKMLYYKEILTGKEMCGVVNTFYFNTNLYHFAESLKHNTCLNGKIAIDENGLIKHCPSMKKDYGIYSKKNLVNALKAKEYSEYSNITKDQILVCKDCEFRNICTDCRAYIEEPDHLFSKPKKCNYDPYTCTWNNN
jgi:SPASM domain peptide maturase of grasp-with-spasm system